MTVKEALETIIRQVDVSTFEEEIATVTNALAGKSDTGEDWKQKFLELEEKYKKRFVSMLDDNYSEPEESNEDEEEEIIDLDKLDFDGSTE